MNPDDAVQAHLVLAAQRSLAMHFGTFHLTDEAVDEPARALVGSLNERSIKQLDFRAPRFGETFGVKPWRE